MTQKEMSEKITRIDERTERTDKILCGNGQPGLIDKHVMLCDRVLKIETSRKTWGVVIGILATILTIVNGIIGTYISFLAYNKSNQNKNLTKEVKREKYQSLVVAGVHHADSSIHDGVQSSKPERKICID